MTESEKYDALEQAVYDLMKPHGTNEASTMNAMQAVAFALGNFCARPLDIGMWKSGDLHDELYELADTAYRRAYAMVFLGEGKDIE